MRAPWFLDLAHALRLHRSLIEHYGNKRTGAVSAIVFLALNDIEVDDDEQGLVELTLSVATGEAGKTEIAEFFRSHAH